MGVAEEILLTEVTQGSTHLAGELRVIIDDETDIGAFDNTRHALYQSTHVIYRTALRSDLNEIGAAVAELLGDLGRITAMQIGSINERIEEASIERLHIVPTLDSRVLLTMRLIILCGGRMPARQEAAAVPHPTPHCSHSSGGLFSLKALAAPASIASPAPTVLITSTPGAADSKTFFNSEFTSMPPRSPRETKTQLRETEESARAASRISFIDRKFLPNHCSNSCRLGLTKKGWAWMPSPKAGPSQSRMQLTPAAFALEIS